MTYYTMFSYKAGLSFIAIEVWNVGTTYTATSDDIAFHYTNTLSSASSYQLYYSNGGAWSLVGSATALTLVNSVPAT